MLVYAFLLITTCTIAQQINKPYNFPVRPDMQEWKELKTHDEMLAVLQLPVNILNNMSTEALVETCLNYPLLPDIWAFNSYQQGIDKAVSGFNGFQKLQLHKNAGDELLKRYQKINMDDLEKKKTYNQQGDFILSISKIEALLSIRSIVENLSKSNKKTLLNSLLLKNKEMRNNGQYSRISIEANTYVVIKILLHEDYILFTQKIKEDKNLEKFCRIGAGLNKSTLENIIEIANSFLLSAN